MIAMFRFTRRLLLALTVTAAVHQASAFSPIGPLDGAFQAPAIGYNPLNTDIGGPMNLGEEYRWNLQTIYYGFDPSFVNYFGSNGVAAINQAIAILNGLPAMSKLSSGLNEFPTDATRVNFTASALGLFDLKSAALSFLVEELGLTAPERYVWTLRDRRVIGGTTFYLVIKRNFDPVTLEPSSFVNDILYTYFIDDPIQVTGGTFADAVEVTVDPLNFGYTSVVSFSDSIWGFSLLPGGFFVNLTRDDVGGLRYLYAGKKTYANYNVETLVPNVITNGAVGGGGSPWGPVGGQPILGTALRPGVDKILFKQVNYDSTFGQFIQTTNRMTDTVRTGNRTIKQTLQRALVTPDIVFAAADLGLDAGGNPLLVSRTAAFVNNAALNTTAGGNGPAAGPGQINPPVFITFSKLGPAIQNATPNFLDEANPNTLFNVWGSFDGTTNPPVIYPSGTSIQTLVLQVFGGH